MGEIRWMSCVECELGDVMLETAGMDERAGAAVVERPCPEQQHAAVLKKVRPDEPMSGRVVQFEQAQVVRDAEVPPDEVVCIGLCEHVQLVLGAEGAHERRRVIEWKSVGFIARAKPREPHRAASSSSIDVFMWF
jgi:hypothetical protein